MPRKLLRKKILLFSPQFFGYGQSIAHKLRSYGASVDYFDERPGNDFMTKSLIRINKSLLNRKTHVYYTNIFNSLKNNHYDYVVFLNLEAILKKDLLKLKEAQPTATFILYMWDSIKNKKHTSSLLPFFDFKHTFDKDDSKTYNSFNFRPLFFLDEYRAIETNTKIDTDVLFIGTVHSDRYQLLQKIHSQCKQLNKKTDFFMFFQSKKLFYVRKALDKSFSNAQAEDFSFVPLSRNEIIAKVKRANVILDIQHPGQTGLTMRTIEMIGAKKKIITTNPHITEYNFYNPNNILYLNREKVELNKTFFETAYEELNSKIYNYYSIDGWLDEVFRFFR